MTKVNHHSLKYKMEKELNKTYKHLKQKQKAKIADWMYRETCSFYSNHERMPNESEVDDLTKMIYTKICSLAICVPYQDVLLQFQKSCRCMKNEF